MAASNDRPIPSGKWQWILDDGEEITPAQAMENLGLKLDERRGPVEFLVIENAQMPTPN